MSNEKKVSEQYRKDTKEMHRLDKDWKRVYSGRKTFLCQTDEFIERETEKGGRNDWQ